VKSEAKKSIGVDVYVGGRVEMLRDCLRARGFQVAQALLLYKDKWDWQTSGRGSCRSWPEWEGSGPHVRISISVENKRRHRTKSELARTHCQSGTLTGSALSPPIWLQQALNNRPYNISESR
jgi:hypothetical protein